VATNASGGIELFAGALTDSSANALSMVMAGTSFNTTQQDAFFQVEGQTNQNLIYADPSLSSTTENTNIFLISYDDGNSRLQIDLSAVPTTPLVIGQAFTFSPTSGAYSNLSGTVDVVLSTVSFAWNAGTDLGPNSGGQIMRSFTFSAEAVGILCQPNTQIGDVAGQYKFDVSGDMRVQGTGYGISWQTTSDKTYKKDIISFDNAEAMQIVQQLRPVKYNWRVDEFPERNFTKKADLGFIAQEVKQLLPQVVNGDEDGKHTVDYARMVSVLTAAIQHLSKEVAELKAKQQ